MPKEGLISQFRKGYRGMKSDLEEPDVSEIELKKKRFRLIVLFGSFMSVLAFLISISISSGG
jgi:iron complex transport system permease protein